jgi:hypothetical protein
LYGTRCSESSQTAMCCSPASVCAPSRRYPLLNGTVGTVDACGVPRGGGKCSADKDCGGSGALCIAGQCVCQVRGRCTGRARSAEWSCHCGAPAVRGRCDALSRALGGTGRRPSSCSTAPFRHSGGWLFCIHYSLFTCPSSFLPPTRRACCAPTAP